MALGQARTLCFKDLSPSLPLSPSLMIYIGDTRFPSSPLSCKPQEGRDPRVPGASTGLAQSKPEINICGINELNCGQPQMTDKQFRPYPVGWGGLLEKIRALGLWEYLWIGWGGKCEGLAVKYKNEAETSECIKDCWPHLPS